jgi:hypothetical protein
MRLRRSRHRATLLATTKLTAIEAPIAPKVSVIAPMSSCFHHA